MSSLAPGWQEVTAPDGRIYYWNVTTNETSWTFPSGAPPPPPPSSTSDASLPGGASFASSPLSSEVLCQKCEKVPAKAKVSVTTADGRSGQFMLCKDCAIAAQAKHAEKAKAAASARPVSKVSRVSSKLTIKIGKYDEKKKRRPPPALEKVYGLQKEDKKASSMQQQQKLEGQLAELDKELASLTKGRDGLQQMLPFYTNDAKQTAEVDKQIAAQQKLIDGLSRKRDGVQSQLDMVKRGENPLDPKAGVARAASVIKAKPGAGQAKALMREWGLTARHANLSTEQKRAELYNQLDELEAALGVEQKSKQGLGMLVDQYKDNPDQMIIVESQLRDIESNLSGLEVQLDKVQDHIASLASTSATWQEVVDPSTNRKYFWNTQTSEVSWTVPAELAASMAPPPKRMCDICQQQEVATKTPQGQFACMGCAAAAAAPPPAPTPPPAAPAAPGGAPSPAAAPAPAAPPAPPPAPNLSSLNKKADAMQAQITKAKQMQAQMQKMAQSLPPPPVPPSGPPPGATSSAMRGNSASPLPPPMSAGLPPPLSAGLPPPARGPPPPAGGPPPPAGGPPPPAGGPPPHAAAAAAAAPPPAPPPPPMSGGPPPPPTPPATIPPPSAAPTALASPTLPPIGSVVGSDKVLGHFRSISDFTAEDEGEMSTRKGDKVAVLEMCDDGWWKAMLVNANARGEAVHTIGYVASTFLAKI